MAEVNDIHPVTPLPALPTGKQPGNKRQQPGEKKPEKVPGEDAPHRPDDTAHIDEFA